MARIGSRAARSLRDASRPAGAAARTSDWSRRRCFRTHRRLDVRRRRVAVGAGGILQPADEGILQRADTAPGDEGGRAVADQHATGMHQRDTIAAFGLVHEVGRDEDGDLLAVRQVDHHPPEGVARDRIDAGGGLIEDQQGRFVDHRHRERQALPLAERQGRRQRVQHVEQLETASDLLDASRDRLLRQAEQAGVEVEVLPHGQLAVEREGLRHVADAAAGLEVLGVDRLTEQPGLAFARRRAGRSASSWSWSCRSRSIPGIRRSRRARCGGRHGRRRRNRRSAWSGRAPR